MSPSVLTQSTFFCKGLSYFNTFLANLDTRTDFTKFVHFLNEAWPLSVSFLRVLKKSFCNRMYLRKDLSYRQPIKWFTMYPFFLLCNKKVLGIDSEFCNVEALVTGIVDNYPKTLLKHRKLFTVGMCFFMFILGIPMCTNVSMKKMKVLFYQIKRKLLKSERN